MKKMICVLAAGLILVSCATKDAKSGGSTDTTTVLNDTAKKKAMEDTANYTTIQWIDPVIKDLGNLKKDQTVELSYRFKNTGDKNLVIENVTAQCGCTIPEKPERAFAPGEEGEIKAKFNGSGSGAVSKHIYVTANTKPEKAHTLTFNGEIKE